VDFFYGAPKFVLFLYWCWFLVDRIVRVHSHRRPTAMRYAVEILLEVGKDDPTILRYIISSHSFPLKHFRVIIETFRDDTKRHF